MVYSLIWCAAALAAGPPGTLVKLGEASYLQGIPPGTPQPRPPRRSAQLKAPLPTNRFWSSLIAGEAPLPQYPHPLAVHPSAQGLRVQAPPITVDDRGLTAVLNSVGEGEDLRLSGTRVATTGDISLKRFGDWSVRVRMAGETAGFDVTYAHGSPYVYASFDNGGAKLDFADSVTLWSGDANSPTLGITVRGRHYGLFAPKGSSWSGLGTNTWRNAPQQARYFSLALLPDASAQTLALFARYAHAHIVDTRASWTYDPQTARVTTTFAAETQAFEGDEHDTVFALYPHQWAHTTAPLLAQLAYPSVRGSMRLFQGRQFSTELTFPGVLPSVPPVVTFPADRAQDLVASELRLAAKPPLDAYFEGKLLGRLATALPFIDAVQPTAAPRVLAEIERRLAQRFSARDRTGRIKTDRFDYDPTWGALIARPAAFGSDTELNDHHFHYGYYLRAAAEIAQRDPSWIKDNRFGGMIKLLVRDIASADRHDEAFPFLRNFDVYAGHSWASGFADNAAGNNQESSSEAMNAWAALVLLGHATKDKALRDLGIYLFTTELSSIESYWFDPEHRTFPADMKTPALALIWGGKARLETWFSSEPEALFGINWLPFHGASLYLGRYPATTQSVYEHLLEMRGSAKWKMWGDLVIMYRALSNPEDASRQLKALGEQAATEEGNSRLGLEHWVGALQALGQVDRTVTANTPLFAVFARGASKIHVAYRLPLEPAFVAKFSDGASVRCTRPGFNDDRQ